MSYLIAVDSCGELTEEMKNSGCVVSVPLTLELDGYHIVDDEGFDQADFLKRMAACVDAPHSACPSPQAYAEVFERGANHIFGVTLSANLSGSYNSAVIGRDMYLEEHPDQKIHIFNSCSASIGETLIAHKIMELEEKELTFEEIVEQVEAYIASQQTWFVLESLENLRKNGRLTNLKAKVATMLNIKPVCMSTPEGTITQLTQVRGMNRALLAMVSNIEEIAGKDSGKVLAISHCNCYERAVMVRDAILERIKVKDVILLDTKGVSSMYADNGGIIVVI